MHKCMTTPIKGINVKMDVEIEFGKNWGELNDCSITAVNETIEKYLNVSITK